MVDPARCSRPTDRSSSRVKLEYFSDSSCFGMALQESLEEGYKADYPTDDGGIHPDFFKPCITCCRCTTRTCWASRERVESRRQDPSNFVAVSAPSLSGQDPSNFVAAILRCLQCSLRSSMLRNASFAYICILYIFVNRLHIYANITYCVYLCI